MTRKKKFIKHAQTEYINSVLKESVFVSGFEHNNVVYLFVLYEWEEYSNKKYEEVPLT